MIEVIFPANWMDDDLLIKIENAKMNKLFDFFQTHLMQMS
jgi:hypothetical protein